MSVAIRAVHSHPWMQRTLAIIGSRTSRLVLTALLVGFGLSQIPLADVFARLEGASLPWIGVGIALLLVGQVISGQRWRQLAGYLGLHASSRWFTAVYLRGCFYNSVLPTGIGGDALRITSARRLSSWGVATRSVVMDRVSGLIALALAAGLLLPIASLGLPAALTLSAAGLCAAGLAATITMAARRHLAGWVAWTLAYELVWFTGVWALARALSIQMGWATPAIVLIVGLAMALPISFGGHGAREAGFVLALAPLGVAADGAVALGVLFGCALALVGLTGAFVRIPPARRIATAVPTPIAPAAPLPTASRS